MTSVTGRSLLVRWALVGFALVLAGLGTSSQTDVWAAFATDSLGLAAVAPVPTSVGQLSGVVAVEAGAEHSLALRSDGAVLAWGSNTCGQLGLLDWTSFQPTPVQVPGLSSITAISSSSMHSLALSSTGQVFSWGSNNFGELGRGISTGCELVGAVNLPMPAVAISAGHSFSLAVLSDGTVWAWGANDVGQLGIGHATSYGWGWGELQPVEAAAVPAVTAISAGARHSLALGTDGSVWAWGEGRDGQLGDGGTEASALPKQVSLVSGATAIKATSQASWALLDGGTLDYWGAGASPWTVTPSPVPGLAQDIDAFSATNSTAFARGSSGEWYSWGLNASGQLANGTSGSGYQFPQAVPGLIASAVSLGQQGHAMSLGPGGAVQSWGLNAAGQLGNATTANLNVPQAVLAGRSGVAVCTGESEAVTAVTCIFDSDDTNDSVTWASSGGNLSVARPFVVFVEAAEPESIDGSLTFSVSASWNSSVSGIGQRTMQFTALPPAECSNTFSSPTATLCQISYGGFGWSFQNWSAEGFTPETSGATYQQFQAIGSPTGSITAHFLNSSGEPRTQRLAYQFFYLPAGTPDGSRLDVYGSGFQPGATIVIGSFALNTTFDSTDHVHSNIPSWVASQPGPREIIVSNGSSIPKVTLSSVVIEAPPPPSLDSVWPTALPANDYNTEIVVLGTSFQSGATIHLNDSGSADYEILASFYGPGELRFGLGWIWPTEIPAGSYAVTVVNPDSTTSGSVSLTLGDVLVPTVSSVTPAVVSADDVRGIVQGANFLGGTIQLSAPGVSGSYSTDAILINDTQLEFSFAGQEVPPGVYSLQAFNPMAIGSVPISYTVLPPEPPNPPSSPPPHKTLIAGGVFSMRLLDNGSVLGWGNPAALPGFTLGVDYLPVPWPIEGFEASQIVSISGEDNFGFALLEGGEIFGWGSSYAGQLNGNGLTNIVEVDTGHDHGVALKADGTVWAWGGNSYGQAGQPASYQVEARRVPGLTGIDRISAGQNQSMALDIDSGRVWVWGAFVGSTPTLVSNVVDPIAISAGGNQAGTILQASGQVRQAFSTFASVVPGLPGNFVAVATGQASSLALTADGEVWAWGQNYGGLVGAGLPPGTYSTAQRVVGLPPVTTISVSSTALVLDQDGTMWGWGDNYLGQIGDGTTTTRFVPSRAISTGEGSASCFAESGALRIQQGGTWTNCQFIPGPNSTEAVWAASGYLSVEPTGGQVTALAPEAALDPLPPSQSAGTVTVHWSEGAMPRERVIEFRFEGPSFCPSFLVIPGQSFQCGFVGFDGFMEWEASGLSMASATATPGNFTALTPGPASVTARFLDDDGAERTQIHSFVVAGATGIAPTSAPAQQASVDLEVLGSGFAPGWVVRVNGANVVTTFVSPTKLRATIPATAMSIPQSLTISVAQFAAGPTLPGVLSFDVQPHPIVLATLAFAVLDDDGGPIAGAQVQITGEQPDASQTFESYTTDSDAMGSVRFEDIPAGSWRYAVSAPGYAPTSGLVELLAEGSIEAIQLEPTAPELGVSFTVAKTSIEDTYITTIDLAYAPVVSTPALQLIPGLLLFVFDCEGETLPRSIKVRNPGSVVMTDVGLDLGASNRTTLQFRQTSPSLILAPGEEGTIYFTVTGVPGSTLTPAGLYVQGSYRQFNHDQTLRRGVPVWASGDCFGQTPEATVDSGSGRITITGPFVPDWSWDFFRWPSSGSGGGGSSVASGSVRVRLSQQIAIQREAFAAALELTNTSGLEARDIRVVLSAATPGGELVTAAFGITDPELTGGLSGVDGAGTLPAGSSGEAAWTLIPSTELGGQAPSGLQYLVKANLFYKIGNVEFEVETEPQPITVTPQPELELHYTVNEHVIGGVFTVQLEIRNVGHGVARGVTVTSLAPELLSNSSGLPISFAIVGSQLDGGPRTSSPNLVFGDIAPGQSRTGRFFGTASQDGYFTEDISYSISHNNYKGIALDPLITAITVALRDPSAIVGSIREPDGSPVSGATVTVRWWADGIAALQATSLTAGDGSYSVGVDLQGDSGAYVFEVDAYHQDYWIPARRLLQLTEAEITPMSHLVDFVAFDSGLRFGTGLWDPHTKMPVSGGLWSPAGACAGEAHPIIDFEFETECAGLSGIGSKLPSTQYLVFLTHGWCGWDELFGCAQSPEWNGPFAQLARLIGGQVATKPWAGQWEMVYLDWAPYSGSAADLVTCVDRPRENAETIGTRVGPELAELGYQYVHFVGHSAGAWLIDAAGDGFGANNHQTYLDAFVGCANLGGVGDALGIRPFGETSVFAEQFVDKNVPPPFTEWDLRKVLNVDVTAQQQGFESHGWPIAWYALSVADPSRSAADGLGFALAREWTNVAPSFPMLVDACSGGKCTRGEVVHLNETNDALCEVPANAIGLTFCSVNSLLKPLHTFNHFIVIAGGVTSATIASAWPGSDVELSLVSPSGRIIDRTTTADDVVHILGPTHESYTLSSPEAGTWRIAVFGRDVAEEGEEAKVTVLLDLAPPELVADIRRADGVAYQPGSWSNQTVTVEVTCSDLDSGVASCPDDAHYASEGSFNWSGVATDGAGNTASASFGPIQIDKTPPTASPSQSPMANASGWTANDVQVMWNWADSGSGVDSSACTTTTTNSSGEGIQSLTATCADVAGNIGSASLVVRVDKTSPQVTLTSPPDLSVSPIGLVLSFGATDSTSGVATQSAILTNSTSSSQTQVVSGSVISTPGVYTLVVTATDAAGNVSSATSLFVVYDPSAGFVTGGGWINSPAGAYSPNPALAGKATFGFVAQYKKGATEPTGNTEFQFKVANLSFTSTSYDWLVVSGSKAQFRGRGTINGQGDYAFFVTASDGDSDGDKKPDKFRIRIWDRLNGGLVYDNQLGAPDDADPTTVLGGGSIVVHR